MNSPGERRTGFPSDTVGRRLSADIKKNPRTQSVLGFRNFVVRPVGFEPATPWFVARCSIQLSYGRNSGVESYMREFHLSNFFLHFFLPDRPRNFQQQEKQRVPGIFIFSASCHSRPSSGIFSLNHGRPVYPSRQNPIILRFTQSEFADSAFTSTSSGLHNVAISSG